MALMHSPNYPMMNIDDEAAEKFALENAPHLTSDYIDQKTVVCGIEYTHRTRIYTMPSGGVVYLTVQIGDAVPAGFIPDDNAPAPF